MVAARSGVNVQSFRSYERRRLLTEPERRPSGYREYAPGVVERVRFIKRAQELGFTLRDVAELLALREAGPRGQLDARALAVAKMEEIDRKLRQLGAMRRALNTLVEACACADGAPACAILEALDEGEGGTGTKASVRHSRAVHRAVSGR